MAETAQTLWEKRDATKAAAQEQVAPPKQGHGCCFYGCMTVLVLTVVLIVGTILGIRQGIKWVAKNYTDTEQAALPAAGTLADRDLIDVNARYDAFLAASQKGEACAIELSADEINGLIDSRQDMKEARGKIRVAIDEDVLSGSFAVPLDSMNLAVVKGRYLNGSGSFKVWTQNGMLVVTLEDAEFNGRKLPPVIIKELAKKNLMAKAYEDVEDAKQLQKFKKVEVSDGKLKIELAEGPAAVTATEAPKAP